MYQSASKSEFIAKAELGFLDLSDLFLWAQSGFNGKEAANEYYVT